MKLVILDSATDPAKPGGENEDRIGWNATAAFVIDGATSLGDPIVAPPRSDAEWLAERARAHFIAALNPATSTVAVVRDFNASAQEAFLAAGGDGVERWRHPNAGFQMLRVMDDGVEVAGLADSVLFLRDGAGAVARYTGFAGSRGSEQNTARKVVARLGGLGPTGESHRDAETLEALRVSRARLNTPASIYTLGIVPAAAEHVLIHRPAVTLPAVGILCSDGLADLVDNYRFCSAEELIARALDGGLGPLLAALRRIEREVDPDGLQFPRYKRCDDASAILLEITN